MSSKSFPPRKARAQKLPYLVLTLGTAGLLCCGDARSLPSSATVPPPVPGAADPSEGNRPMPADATPQVYRDESVEVHQRYTQGWPSTDTCSDGKFCIPVDRVDLDANCHLYAAIECVEGPGLVDSHEWQPCRIIREESRTIDPNACYSFKKKIFEHRPFLLPNLYDCSLNESCGNDESIKNIEFTISGRTKRVEFYDGVDAYFSADFRALRTLVREMGFH